VLGVAVLASLVADAPGLAAALRFVEDPQQFAECRKHGHARVEFNAESVGGVGDGRQRRISSDGGRA
jgi:hypothetical protein